MGWRLLRFLGEGMQNQNDIRKFRQIDDPIGARIVMDAYFPHARADGFHRLPVMRIEPCLHALQVQSGPKAGSLRKRPDRLPAVTQKHHVFRHCIKTDTGSKIATEASFNYIFVKYANMQQCPRRPYSTVTST